MFNWLYRFLYPIANFNEHKKLVNKNDIMGEFKFVKCDDQCLYFVRNGHAFHEGKLKNFRQYMIVNTKTEKALFTTCHAY